MKYYDLHKVPLKERPGYIWTYYKWHIFAVLAGLFLTGGLIYMLFFHPHPDISILWLGSDYNMMTDTILRDRMEHLPWDINGDGTVNIGLQYVNFTDNLRTNMQTQMQLTTLMAAGDFHIYLVGDAGYEWLKENGILGTWTDFDAAGGKDKELFEVSCSDLDIFCLGDRPLLEGVRLVIGPPPEDSKQLEYYRKQMEALNDLFVWTETEE